jgi:CRISPR/Cas system CMR subunit Cmr6 (Cas7 group RAMP superfamily)
MVKGKHKNISKRNQDYLASSAHSSSTTSNPGYANTQEKQDSDLKSYLMTRIKESRKDINKSLKEIQENTGKQEEEFKEETQKCLKELHENTTKHVKELNETIQVLKMEIETMNGSI